MLTRTLALSAAAALCVLAARPPAAADDGKSAAPQAWVYPQDWKCAGRRLTVQEPQVTAFDASVSRVSLRYPAMLTDPLGRASWGTVEVAGTLRVDLASRLVRLDTLQPGNAVFPGVAQPDLASVQAGLADALPKALTLRVELLTARAGAWTPEASPPRFSKDPPAIVVRYRPAVLVQTDGEPVLLDVEEFPLQYVGNTATDVFRDTKTDMWYLLLDGTWMNAKAFAGPWRRLDGPLPSAMSQIPGSHPRGHVRRFVPGTPEFTKRGIVPAAKDLPEVIVTDKPSELLLLAGDPLFTFIPGIRLMAVANTESDLFFHPQTNLYYLLVSGRWFTASEIEGPWTAAGPLPEEFAKIPRDHVRGHVVWCVPGTPEAAEACALASLEERVTVNKYAPAQVLFEPEGKGPVAEPLDGDVKSVANTEDDCFAVGKAWYACQRGVWFKSEDGRSKWLTCADVPEALRKLPETSPSWHVRFCRALGIDGETAGFAISTGYYGTIPFGTAPVYGTGSTKRGMVRNKNWYPCARTWGENRWYDPATGIFQPRSVRSRADGTTSADEWSPYTASYGRVVYYGCRYDQGGRRMFPYSSEEMKWDASAGRPDIYALWLAQVKKRESLDASQFPFGDRASETAPAEPRLASDETGRVWRTGAKGPETFEKGAWIAGKPAPEVVAWMDALARVDARPAQWKRWRELRAAPIPVNPVVTAKTK
jgi:hypothetical protein